MTREEIEQVIDLFIDEVNALSYEDFGSELFKKMLLGGRKATTDIIVPRIQEKLSVKEPSNLDEAAIRAANEMEIPTEHSQPESLTLVMRHIAAQMFKAGVEWATNDLFENNRLKDCEALSEEDYKLESDFVDAHIKKNHRTPTFLDAIKYGAKWMAGQGETFNGFMSMSGKRSLIAIEGASQNFKFGEDVIVQIRKR